MRTVIPNTDDIVIAQVINFCKGLCIAFSKRGPFLILFRINKEGESALFYRF